jgi:hypothetical protein
MIEMTTNQKVDDIRKDAVFYYLDHIENSMIPNTTLYGIIQKLKNKQQDSLTYKLTKTTKHAKRHFWLTDVCTCHGLLQSHSA